MLSIEPIVNGIVLDHIQTGNGLEIFKRLGLKDVGYPVALLMGVPSTKMGNKDMIKISDVFHLDLTMLGLLDPDIVVNYIEESKVVKKIRPGLPKEVQGLIKCKNPRCITSSERNLNSVFTLVDATNKEYQCFFCEERVKVDCHYINQER